MSTMELTSSTDNGDVYEEVRDFLLVNGFQKVDENEKRILLRKPGGEKKVETKDKEQLKKGNTIQLFGSLALLLFIVDCSGAGIVRSIAGPKNTFGIWIVLLLMGIALTISAFMFKSNARKVEVIKEDDAVITMQRGVHSVRVDTDDTAILETLSRKFGAAP